MNDVIIYSRDFEIHLHHFDKVFKLLTKSEMTLILKKCHFVYFNIQILKHHVSKLNFNILKKKTEAIRNFRFFRTFRELKTILKFFDYYKKFVTWYAHLKRFLQKLKTTDFKNNLAKKQIKLNWVNKTQLLLKKQKTDQSIRKLKLTKNYFKFWNFFKKIFIISEILTFFDFSKSFILYCDGSKKRKYDIIVHQMKKNEMKRSIFFFRCFINAKTNYWTIKLKTRILIWTLIKLLQYFDDEFFTIVIDHSILKTILQININDKRSVRFNEWIMFLFTFQSRMTIIHKKKFIKTQTNFRNFFANEIFRNSN